MLIFRADGNSEIGSGHIMRCLSIADAGRKWFNQDSLFVLASHDFCEVIKKRGYKCAVLDTDYGDMEPEEEKIRELAGMYRPAALFADSYYVTPHYLEMLQRAAGQAGGRLVYIDDVMAFAYPCDMLINYNIYGPDEREEYEELYKRTGVPVPRLILGTSYVPLRDEFQNLPVRTVQKEAKHILISTGGADAEHTALKLAKYLAGMGDICGGGRFGDIRFHFIIGAMNGDYERIKSLTKDKEHIFLHYNVANMRQMMEKCDVAISAAGSTLYELCAAQTPALTYILADNQIPGAEGFKRHHIMRCAGDVRNMEEKDVAKKLLADAVKLAGDYERRREISARQRALVDGNGAKRIMEAVLTL